jgi:hypothetical protein
MGLARENEDLIQSLDGLHSQVCAGQRELFRVIAQVDLHEAWRDAGAGDLAHWVCMRYGISYWKALRWIQAAHALEALPLISEAFASGVLGIDKVVELTRFATPETEERLIGWAQGVSCGWIREKGDLLPSVFAGGPGGRTSEVPVLVVLRRKLPVRPVRGAPRGPRGGGGHGPGAAGRSAPGDARRGWWVVRRCPSGRCPGGIVLVPDRPPCPPGPGHRGHPRPPGRAGRRAAQLRGRRRPGHPPRGGEAPGLQRPDPGGAGGPGRPGGAPGTSSAESPRSG